MPTRTPPPAARPTARLKAEAVLWAGLVRCALWVLPFGAVRRAAGRAARARRRGAAASPEAIGCAVRATTAYVPRNTCLVQSLTAQVLLGRDGHDAQLHLGATRAPGGALHAHAWVTSAGTVVVGDGPGVHTPLGTA